MPLGPGRRGVGEGKAASGGLKILLAMTSAVILLALTISCAIPVTEAPAPKPTVPPEAFQRLGEADPFSGETALALEQAVQAFSEARYQEALPGFLEAQRLHGEPIRVIQNWLGNSHSALGDHRAAIQNFTAALELEDNSGEGLPEGSPELEQHCSAARDEGTG